MMPKKIASDFDILRVELTSYDGKFSHGIYSYYGMTHAQQDHYFQARWWAPNELSFEYKTWYAGYTPTYNMADIFSSRRVQL